MKRPKNHVRSAALVACSAMAAALLGGFVSHGAYARAETEAGASDAQALKDIEKAEKRVSRSPDKASLRTDLARAYLAAGRFQSAAQAYRDAVSLGDNDARTGLGLALASIGAGDKAEAMRTLAQWRDSIPASDLGLAVALAGQPGQGVAILTDVVRGGDVSAKARQNLAYSYALNGQWAQARIIAAQDVPGDQLDARMAEWARMVRPQAHEARIAALIGAPMGVVDPGQPTALALGGALPEPQFARVEPQAPAPQQVAIAEGGELPALAAAEPAPQVAAEPVPQAPRVATVARRELPAQAEDPRFVSRPVVQKVAESKFSAAFERPAAARTSSASVRAPAATKIAPAAKGTHLVQLGSFRSREGAERAWGIFVSRNPRLRDHTMRITEAMVRGTRYYRVAAEGFDRAAAQSMCSTVKSSGRGCLAYAASSPLPGGASAKNAHLATR